MMSILQILSFKRIENLISSIYLLKYVFPIFKNTFTVLTMFLKIDVKNIFVF